MAAGHKFQHFDAAAAVVQHVVEHQFGVAMRCVVVAVHGQRAQQLHALGIQRHQHLRLLAVAIGVASVLLLTTLVVPPLAYATVYELKRRRPELEIVINGGLGGLVAITAGAASMDPALAVVTGLLGGMLAVKGNDLLLVFGLDDVVGAVAVHGFAGAWGIIAAGRVAELVDELKTAVGAIYLVVNRVNGETLPEPLMMTGSVSVPLAVRFLSASSR